jgi:hypothetical protein
MPRDHVSFENSARAHAAALPPRFDAASDRPAMFDERDSDVFLRKPPLKKNIRASGNERCPLLSELVRFARVWI